MATFHERAAGPAHLSPRTAEFVSGSRFPSMPLERLDTMQDHQLRLSFKMDSAAILDLRAVAAWRRAMPLAQAPAYQTVRQQVAEMVKAGRLRREHIPEDYDLLVERLSPPKH